MWPADQELRSVCGVVGVVAMVVGIGLVDPHSSNFSKHKTLFLQLCYEISELFDPELHKPLPSSLFPVMSPKPSFTVAIGSGFHRTPYGTNFLLMLWCSSQPPISRSLLRTTRTEVQ
eukprot:TRINITY_DN3167_c1_g1_i1.p2 TRINITY_DN3167_c1_g1~~TRINITY_DN3167_c1_g1_i1.p2  ORF type:complete len:117 (-),score=8.44 TRINITY_DN3167_c1_g1_i1:111-461(-)